MQISLKIIKSVKETSLKHINCNKYNLMTAGAMGTLSSDFV